MGISLNKLPQAPCNGTVVWVVWHGAATELQVLAREPDRVAGEPAEEMQIWRMPTGGGPPSMNASPAVRRAPTGIDDGGGSPYSASEDQP